MPWPNRTGAGLVAAAGACTATVSSLSASRDLAGFVAKARSDGMRGFVVVPFTPSNPTWPALAAASLTPVDGQREPCTVLFDPAAYVREGDDLGGAQRLAVSRPEASRLWPVGPAYVSGVRAAVWLARRAQAATVTPERVGRSEPSAPRSGAPAARQVGGQAQSRVGRPGRVRGACIM